MKKKIKKLLDKTGTPYVCLMDGATEEPVVITNVLDKDHLYLLLFQIFVDYCQDESNIPKEWDEFHKMGNSIISLHNFVNSIVEGTENENSEK